MGTKSLSCLEYSQSSHPVPLALTIILFTLPLRHSQGLSVRAMQQMLQLGLGIPQSLILYILTTCELLQSLSTAKTLK